MSDLDTAAGSDATTTPARSTGSVLAIVGAMLAIPVVIGIVLLCRGAGSGGASAGDLLDGVRENRVQAVYLTDGSVYFGDLRAGSGDWLELRDAFFLRRTEADAKAGEAAQASTDLVPLSQVLGGDGDMQLNAREVIQVQNLAAKSEVGRAVEDATS